MRIRHLIAGAAFAVTGILVPAYAAHAAETTAEPRFADHQAEECHALLEEGKKVTDCHEAPSPILPEANEIFYGGSAFVVLFLVMRSLAYPAIKKGMDARTERIRESIDEADKLKGEAATALAQHQASVADAKGEANRIVEEARTAAEAVRTDLIARAEAEANEIKAKGREDIEAGKARAIAELQSQVGDLTIALAEKAVERSLDHATNRQLIDNYINNLGTN